MICYLVYSDDKYELPVGVYDSLAECSCKLHIPYSTLYSALSRSGHMPLYKLWIIRVQLS